MTRRIIPTRVVETGRVVRGPSGQGVGWLQSLADRARNIKAQIAGINDRLTSPFVNGFPGCVIGKRLFKADTTRTITITYPIDPDDATPGVLPTFAVNPVITAGETYKIDIPFTPPGVFMAHNLSVGIQAGFIAFANLNRPGITPLADYRQIVDAVGGNTGGFVGGPSNIMTYTMQQQVLGDFATFEPMLPFLWNIVDEKSGRQYAQDWLPHGLLMNTRAQARAVTGQVNDGELFEFDAPWLFERDAEVSFLFRPIMDLYQLANTDAQFPYGSVDDRTGGRRFEQATVHVEFHGNRYYSAQDMLKDGAYVTDANEENGD